MAHDPTCIFDVTDFWGRRVRCTWKRWTDHILPKRPEFAGIFAQEALVKAIEAPFEIRHDAYKKRRHCFYGEGAWYSIDRQIVKVVIEEVRSTPFSPKEGTVITAYLLYEIPPNEPIVYRR